MPDEHTPLTPDEVAEYRRLAEAATPEPWEVDEGCTYEHGRKVSVEKFVRRPDDDVSIAADILDPETSKPSQANAAFIATARTALPRLCADWERQRAALLAYADKAHWGCVEDDGLQYADGNVWVGSQDGPDLARQALRLEPSEEAGG